MKGWKLQGYIILNTWHSHIKSSEGSSTLSDPMHPLSVLKNSQFINKLGEEDIGSTNKLTLTFEVNVINQHHHRICAEPTDQVLNLPSSFLLDVVIDKLGRALGVKEVGAEEFGLVEDHGVIKESRKERQVLAQEKGTAYACL